uniref:Uncharacterized protein n=1 Tax=Vitrella brassicaformis TaxID=1169539 RepID=A0A7S1P9T4_9ALVE
MVVGCVALVCRRPVTAREPTWLMWVFLPSRYARTTITRPPTIVQNQHNTAVTRRRPRECQSSGVVWCALMVRAERLGLSVCLAMARLLTSHMAWMRHTHRNVPAPVPHLHK